MIHIYPLVDVRDHLLTAQCWCKPRISTETMIHQRSDGAPFVDLTALGATVRTGQSPKEWNCACGARIPVACVCAARAFLRNQSHEVGDL